MKLRYLFSIILSALFFAGCAELATDSFDNVKLDKTFVVLDVDGGNAELRINATEDWIIDTTYTQDVWPNVITRNSDKSVKKIEPSWLSIDKMGGSKGETVLRLSAEAVAGGRELELCIKAGMNSQFFKVRQGSLEASSATCAEVNAGPDGKTYRVKGTVTSIANTTYGNWYLNDGTGEVYVYGTLDKDGKTKNFASLGIEVGDVVEVEGPKLTYGTTVELVDVTVLSIKKSLLKIITPDAALEAAGGELEVKVAFKGEGLYPVVADDAKSWVSISGVTTKPGTPTKIEQNPADTALVKITVANNTEADPRTGVVTFTSAAGKDVTEMAYTISQKGVATPTIAEVRASAKGALVSTEGTVMALHQKGFILSDATGTIYVYENAAPTVAVGNKIKISGTFDNYYGTLQIKTPTIEVTENTTNVTYPTPIDLTDPAAYEAFATFSADNPTEFAYVKIKGVLSGSYNNTVTVGTSTKTSQFDYSTGDYAALNGKTVVVTAYVKGFHSKGYYQLIETGVFEEGNEPAEATTIVLDVTANAPCAEFPVGSDNKVANEAKEYTVNGYKWTFFGPSYFTYFDDTHVVIFGKKGAYINLPAVEGKALKSIDYLASEGASSSVELGVFPVGGETALSGGESKVATKGATTNWTLAGTAANTSYQLKVTNDKNSQFQKITLRYE